MENITSILAVILVFSTPVFIIAIIFLFIFRSRQETQKTLRLAIEKSDSLSPELMETLKSLQKKPKTPAHDIRAGLVLIAIAAGVVVMCYTGHDWGLGPSLAGTAAVPGFIGLALLILGVMGSRRPNP